eukprot:GHRR01000021.1.p1 GENE.GHRR01000021.1~~GHRR01000021.1.p1  ORF type:complete len:128 (+),score=40.35 GHRR01000021.1:195-578(+)
MAFALSAKTSVVAAPRPCSRSRVVVVQARDNPYHDRSATHKQNAGGFKDANVVRQDKQDQYEYQQERLEWRRKNQAEGIEDRDEPPHNNLAKDMSAEKRGPDVPETGGHKDTLKDLVKGITGQKKDE